MGGQILMRQAGTFVPILGGGQSTAGNRQDLVPGTYKPSAATTGLLPGYTWDAAGMYLNGVLIPGSLLTGDQVFTGTGGGLTNKVVNGRVICRGIGNTISNCVIRGSASGPPSGAGNGQGLVQCDNTCVDARINDCVLVPQMPSYNWTGLYSHDFTAQRCNIYRTVDGGGAFAANKNTNAKFWGCWLHDLTLFAPDPNHTGDLRTHNDIIQIQGGYGTEIIGCLMEGFLSNWPVGENFVAATSDVTTNPPNVWAPPHAYSASGRCVSTSVIQITPNVGTPKVVKDNVIRNNWIVGGAVAINYADTGAADSSQGSAGVIQNNQFDHWQGIGGSATSTTGHTIDVGIVWTEEGISGNVYEDTQAPVTVRANLRGN